MPCTPPPAAHVGSVRRPRPAEQLAHQFTTDQHAARSGFQVIVVAAIQDLVRASDKQDKQKEAAP